MNEEVENRECLGCSKCTEDKYNRAGEREILGFIRYWGIMSEKTMVRALTRRTVFSRSFSLCTWSEDDLRGALEILLKEGRIRRLGPFIIRAHHV